MNNIKIFILFFFLIVNVLAFLIMLIDKARAGNGSDDRISEGFMFFMATVFGSVGVYLGMFVCRHKTKTWYFLVGIPILIVENSAFLYLLYIFLTKNVLN